jgi:hypothetical protein
MSAEITGTFILTDNVPVEGANGFTAVNYKVYVYTSNVVLGAINYAITIE